jgi:hypothetical protein
LKKHFENSGNISANFHGKYVFKFHKDEIFEFLDYVYHNFDKKAIKAISDFEMYSTIDPNDVWSRLIDREKLSSEFNFELSNHNIKKFKNFYVNDYMLKDAMNSVSMQASITELKEFIFDDFEMYKSYGTDFYYIDILPYVRKLLEYHDAEYDLPKNGWRILDDYFHDFEKVYFSDHFEFFDRDDFSINIVDKDIEDITVRLIKYLRTQYPGTLIDDEMRDQH